MFACKEIKNQANIEFEPKIEFSSILFFETFKKETKIHSKFAAVFTAIPPRYAI